MDGNTRAGSQLTTATGRRAGAAWLLVALLFCAVRAPYLDLPFERDEGEYAYVAWRALEGEVPYRDAFDQKPPGVFAVYAAAFAALGPSIEAVRVASWLWTAASAWLLFLLVRALAGGPAAFWATLAFALLSADPRLGAVAANTELFLLLPATGSLLCAWRARGRPGHGGWWWAGVLLGLACLFKQVAITQLALLLPLAAADARAHGRPLLARGGALLAGVALLPAAVGLAFAALGAGAELLEAVVLHNLAYAGRRAPGEGLDNLLFALGRQAPSALPVWLAAAWGLARARAAPGGAWLAGWLAASLAGAAVGLQFRPHYFVQALPPLCGLAGVGLARAQARLALRVPAGAVPAALVLVLLVAPLAANRAALRARTPEDAVRALYGDNPFAEARAIAERVARGSSAEEPVFVLGSEPEILFYARRRSASRYIFVYPLTGGYAGEKERQRAVLEEIRRQRPRYIVWVNVHTSLLLSEESARVLFDGVAALLRREYGLEQLVHPDEALRRWQTSSPPEAEAWLAGRPSLGGVPWIGVYRRLP